VLLLLVLPCLISPALRAQEADEASAPTEEPAPAKKPAKPKKPYVPSISSSKPGAAKVRLFILSGQSNMHNLKPSASFTPAVEAAFPEDDVVVVKDAQSGQPIRQWVKGWAPGPGSKHPDQRGTGELYERLKSSIAKAMEGKAKPESVVFVWMQGEADIAPWNSSVYEKSLQTLVANLRQNLDAPEMFVVIGRINDHFKNPKLAKSSEEVRQVQENFPKTDPRAAWVDTDDLNGEKDALHLDAANYKILGERFAAGALQGLQKTN
jgi:hypothetical protein